jgi:hypothetical protein
MKMNPNTKRSAEVDLDRLIEEITVDAHGEDEQLWAFRQAFEDGVPLPADGFVIGEPVSVSLFDYDGNERRGLAARCQRTDGSEYVVAASEVTFPRGSIGARYVAAYRKWSGLDPLSPEVIADPRRKRHHKVATADLDLSKPVELVVLSGKENAARCRLLGNDRVLTLRSSRLWTLVPGQIVVVKPHKQWSYAGHPYLSGEVESARLDLPALALVPLRLESRGLWNPDDHYWGEEDEPVEECAKPIIDRGPWPEFEMEQILPGSDPEDFDSDPILESNDLKDAGDPNGARRILMELCQSDLRCLDAHAHLGNLAFDYSPKEAIRHYEVGVRIGELSLGLDFDMLLPWGYIDNRPFLRCLSGLGLCLWRLNRFQEAEGVFNRMLRLNPTDNQGARFLVHDVRAQKPWTDEREKG